VNDVIQPRFDSLASLPANLSQYRPVVVDGMDRIASGLEFIHASLAKLDQPVQLGLDQFIELNNSQSGSGHRYNMLGLDFKLPQSDRPPYRYNKKHNSVMITTTSDRCNSVKREIGDRCWPLVNHK